MAMQSLYKPDDKAHDAALSAYELPFFGQKAILETRNRGTQPSQHNRRHSRNSMQQIATS